MDAGVIGLQRVRGVSVVSLRGGDRSTGPALRAAVEQAAIDDSRVVVDLTDADFIDSAVIQAIVDGHVRARDAAESGYAMVIRPGSFVARVFDLVGVTKLVPTFAHTDEAIASLAPVAPEQVRPGAEPQAV
jgi:anti-anti-sigma factor